MHSSQLGGASHDYRVKWREMSQFLQRIHNFYKNPYIKVQDGCLDVPKMVIKKRINLANIHQTRHYDVAKTEMKKISTFIKITLDVCTSMKKVETMGIPSTPLWERCLTGPNAFFGHLLIPDLTLSDFLFHGVMSTLKSTKLNRRRQMTSRRGLYDSMQIHLTGNIPGWLLPLDTR